MQDWVLFILFSIEHEDILNSKGFHISVHLWLLCPLCNFADLSQTLLLATSGENGIQRYAILCNFLPFYRTLTLCWFTTWMSPTRTTTRCWWLTPWRSGARRRSGPRRNSFPSWSQCVSIETKIQWDPSYLVKDTFSYFLSRPVLFLGTGFRKT